MVLSCRSSRNTEQHGVPRRPSRVERKSIRLNMVKSITATRSGPEISVLLPTRGRTQILNSSIMTLIDTCSDPGSLELLFAFDDDDSASSDWFRDNIADKIDHAGSSYTAYAFPRLGYLRLNEYVNALAKKARGKWLMFWGDDALMMTPGWDQKVCAVTDFCVIRMPTHNMHPYAIFPIVPRAWLETFGYISPHQLTDSWVSQIAYIMDIMHTVDIEVVHDRYDLTGNNGDSTWQNRPMLEGNPQDPKDFNHVSWRQRRFDDCKKLAQVLKGQGMDLAWFDKVMAGTQDPWQKMCSAECDPNHQVTKGLA